MLKGKSYKIVVLFLLLPSVVSLVITIKVYFQWGEILNTYVPMINELRIVRNNIAEGHLWLEEAIAGDTHIDINKQVFKLFKNDKFHKFISIRELDKNALPMKQNQILSSNLNKLYLLVVKRWSDTEKYKIGSIEDEKFDIVFREVINNIDNTINNLELKHTELVEYQKRVFLWSIAIFSIMVIIFLFIIIKLLANMEKIQRELEEKKNILEHQAYHDSLTGLHNRLMLDEKLIEIDNDYRRYKRIYSVIMIDIDYFKSINDTHGHLIGDEILIKIANILKEHTRATDVVGRWGGEEFMLICKEANIDVSSKIANILRTNIQEMNFNVSSNITASFGVSEITATSSIDLIIQKADEALYKAKENGRNRVETA